MKCPLLTDKNYGEQLERTMAKGDCLKEECAWWSDEMEQCDPTGMLPTIIAIRNTLGKLVDKMRPELFRNQ